MPKKERHHSIPRFYLKGFIDPHNEPYICVYEKGNPKTIKATVENIAVHKHYYSFLTSSGNKDCESFENAFEKMENKAALIFRKIKNHESMNAQDRKTFAVFLALTMVRVPNYRNNIERSIGEFIKKIHIIMASHSAGFKSMIDEDEKDTGRKIGVPAEELQKFILDGNKWDVKVNPQFSLSMIGLLAKDIASIFYKMNWSFLEATDNFKFVTSDNPLFYFDPTHNPRSLHGVGLANKNIEVTLPISRDLAFLGKWEKSEGYKKLNNDLVKKINRRTIISDSRFVFASQYSDGLNRLVQKYKDSTPRTIVD